ncbi:Lysosomal thioesterase PPT2 [Phytophthora cactorum]|nr:Lysosomal thioesterase PPT2 [Phytophthora cactorum]
MTSTSQNKLLPVFYFHGLTANSTSGDNLKAEFASEGRPFVALCFSEGVHSLGAIKHQIPKAITEIRAVVANDSRFEGGYIFMGHSMGGLIARAAIEEMDDHKVHTLVTLASPYYGLFYGPQEADRVPAQQLPAGLGELMLSPSVFNFSAYSSVQCRGKMQKDLALLSLDAEVQSSNAFINLAWIPVRGAWLASNPVQPTYINANVCGSSDAQCEAEKQRRKSNFLKLKATGVFGHYSEVDSLEKIESGFESLTMLDMKETRGAVFRHVVPNVPHTGWLFDTPLMGKDGMCKFDDVFDSHVRVIVP